MPKIPSKPSSESFGNSGVGDAFLHLFSSDQMIDSLSTRSQSQMKTLRRTLDDPIASDWSNYDSNTAWAAKLEPGLQGPKVGLWYLTENELEG